MEKVSGKGFGTRRQVHGRWKIHIVAAPGSGKTTLGIEPIRRMNGKALILAPSITLSGSSIARIEEAFLCVRHTGEDYSQNLKKLPDMNVQWMERLLQGFLYDDVDSYLCDKTYRELLIADLKSDGLIEKKKVVMTKSAAVEKMLTNSLGKCNSIRDIVFP